ncbi:hypothetical protein ACSSS7_002574 [Eimeria intestinalis]
MPNFISGVGTCVGPSDPRSSGAASSRQRGIWEYCLPLSLPASLWHRREDLRELVHGPKGKCASGQKWKLRWQQEQEQDREPEWVNFLELFKLIKLIALSALVFEFVELIDITWLISHGHIIWIRVESGTYRGGTLAQKGSCESRRGCQCPNTYQPACDSTGRTHFNKCLLQCKGAVFAYDGRCSTN